jgi:hypothetical protein
VRVRNLLMLHLIALTSVACSSSERARMSAEPTACPDERIEISEAHQPWEGPSSWTATCSATDAGVAQKWFCSKTHDRVICTEDPR